MSVQATYLGMSLAIDDLDVENLAYFKHCAAHDFRLQRCTSCNLLRYPPTTACPWCMNPKSDWVPVEAKGAVHSYTEVHHAIQPAFKAHTPYLILLVDLDTQKGKPTKEEALRVVGNLTTPDGKRQHTYDYREGGCRQVKNAELSANLGWANPGTGSAMVMRRG